MCAASVANIYCSLLDVVAWSAICRTAVDRVLVVEATAGRIKLHKLVAHGDGIWEGDGW